MKNFSKTYYTDDLHITIRIKRDELCSMGCRLTIKRKFGSSYHGSIYNFNRLVYTWFYNDKDLFRKYERKMIETKVVPKTMIKEIMDDIQLNLKFEKVVMVTYQPITMKTLWG